MAVLIPVDGPATQLPLEGKSATDALRILQDAVGGYIEAVFLSGFVPGLPVPKGATRQVLIVNEEGRLVTPPLPVNEKASLLAGQIILGPAVLTTLGEMGEDQEDEGETDPEKGV